MFASPPRLIPPPVKQLREKLPLLRKLIGPAFATIMFVLAMRLLLKELQNVTWEEFRLGMSNVPIAQILMAALLVAMNYVLLIAYDLLGLRYIARSVPVRRVSLVSVSGFSLGNNLGTILAASPIRFRFYTQWGLSPGHVLALISVIGVTFWSGWIFISGLVLSSVPLQLPEKVKLPLDSQTLGLVLLGIAVFYTCICVFWRKPWPIGKMHLRPPRPGLMFAQASVAAIDLLISATALYLVLPEGTDVPFSLVLAAYLVAMGAAVLSQVPGGLGILDVILLTLLKNASENSVVASILIFRILYYWLPLMVGMSLLVGYEIMGGVKQARRAEVLTSEVSDEEKKLPVQERHPLEEVSGEATLDDDQEDQPVSESDPGD